MADAAPLTTETYTHEEAIARIAELEAAAADALEALEAGLIDDAVEMLEDLFEDECAGPDEEDEDDVDDELEDDD